MYGLSLLFLFLRVENTLLSRYSFFDAINKLRQNSLQKLITPAFKQKCLTATNYFFQDGLQSLLKIIQTVVEAKKDKLPLIKECSVDDIMTLIEEVQQELASLNPPLPYKFKSILMPPEEDEYIEQHCKSILGDDDKYKFLMNETRELIESPQFSKIFLSTLTSCKDIVRELLSKSFENKSTIQVAKIIPILTKISTTLLSNDMNSTKDLASNIELSPYIDKIFSEPLLENDLDIPVDSSFYLQDILSAVIKNLPFSLDERG